MNNKHFRMELNGNLNVILNFSYGQKRIKGFVSNSLLIVPIVSSFFSCGSVLRSYSLIIQEVILQGTPRNSYALHFPTHFKKLPKLILSALETSGGIQIRQCFSFKKHPLGYF